MEKIGKYQVIRKLGKGATSVVYLARDPFAERDAAIKVVAGSVFSEGERGKIACNLFVTEASLAGQLPFQGSNDINIVYRIANVDPPPPSDLRNDIPPAVDAIVMRALKKSLDERYPTWDAFSFDLADIFRGEHLEKARERIADTEEFNTLLNVLSAGECFGEMAYLGETAGTRGADVSTLSAATVITVPTSVLKRASDACRHSFDRAFLRIPVERLSLANTRLTSV